VDVLFYIFYYLYIVSYHLNAKKNAKGIIKRINKATIMAHRHIIWQLASVFPLHGEKKELERVIRKVYKSIDKVYQRGRFPFHVVLFTENHPDS
jgi:CRISPR/Cas system-associated endoribonuclease Cas2